jgi:hypothetical protein
METLATKKGFTHTLNPPSRRVGVEAKAEPKSETKKTDVKQKTPAEPPQE